ncbi:MAG: hypothetical protein AAF430_12415 [Myxococcota bacterium]
MSERLFRGARVAHWGVALVLVVSMGFAAAAEERREESVGVAPIVLAEDGSEPDGIPRDAALEAAIGAAVLRTAKSLLPADFLPPEPEPPEVPGTEPPPEPTPDEWLAERLGGDPFVYATRFSILEDRGRRPAMFSKTPDVEFEYVVLAAVFVDVSSIRDRLGALGLLAAGSPDAERAWTLVVEDLHDYAPLAVLRRSLAERGGVEAVVPVEFTVSRAVLRVDADRSPRDLLAELERTAPEGLKLVPVELEEDRATLLVEWRPPVVLAPAELDPAEADAEGAGPAAFDEALGPAAGDFDDVLETD